MMCICRQIHTYPVRERARHRCPECKRCWACCSCWWTPAGQGLADRTVDQVVEMEDNAAYDAVMNRLLQPSDN